LDPYELGRASIALPSSNKNIGSISFFFFYGKKNNSEFDMSLMTVSLHQEKAKARVVEQI
jgi:hypothetical protein